MSYISVRGEEQKILFLFFPFIFDDTFKKKEENRCFLLQNRRFPLHCCLHFECTEHL